MNNGNDTSNTVLNVNFTVYNSNIISFTIVKYNSCKILMMMIVQYN